MYNGCGGEKGFKFETLKNKIEKLEFVDKTKLDSLYQTIEAKCCLPHDMAYDKGGGILDFIIANYNFSNNLIGVLHWTNTTGRLGIFLISFFGLNLFGRKYFNWK